MAGPVVVNEKSRECVNTIRVLGASLPEKAKSGHPGAPMGCAGIAYALWGYCMNYSPKNPKWWNRDRFVMSNGHACALQYVMLYLTGYDLSLDDLKLFRQLNSRTPGHPESFMTPGVEVTTGPLGQGLANAVGLALAAKHMAARFNKSDIELFNNHTYCLCGDGCLQEGITSEAASLAGTMGLDKLILLYDSNSITIDGPTDLSFRENVKARFLAYGWDVLTVENANTDMESVVASMKEAKNSTSGKPTMIICKTIIGYGSAKEGTRFVHGMPLGENDLADVSKKFGLSTDGFDVSPDVLKWFRTIGEIGDEKEKEWTELWKRYQEKYEDLANEITRRFDRKLPEGVIDLLPKFPNDSPPASTRSLSHQCLNAIKHAMPELVGGSADLTDSNMVSLKEITDFSKETPEGRYIRYGVREHAMSAMSNALFAYGCFRPFCATFLNFISYAWGGTRLSALSQFGVLYVTSHDSIELGEDGPTHQPIEILPLIRATPNILLIRPCDGVETAAAYALWLKSLTRPIVLALSRANIPSNNFTKAEGVSQGGYILQDFDESRVEAAESAGCSHKVVLASSGTEVQFCVKAKELLETQFPSVSVRLVSMPCWDLFDEQPAEVKESIVPTWTPVTPKGSLTTLYCETSAVFGWEKYFKLTVGMTSFGASGRPADLHKYFGFTPENIANTVSKYLKV